MTINGKYFYGKEVSAYGVQNGYVDYATLASAFDAVLANDILAQTDGVIGTWEQESGFVDNSEQIEKLEEQIEELEAKITPESSHNDDLETERLIEELRDQIDDLEYEEQCPPEIFQYYIVSDNGADILKKADEIVLYNAELDMYLWAVTHWGTSWSYVLTNIKIEN